MVVLEAGMSHWKKGLLDWCCYLSYNAKDMENCYNTVRIDLGQSWGKKDTPTRVEKKAVLETFPSTCCLLFGVRSKVEVETDASISLPSWILQSRKSQTLFILHK